MGSRPPPYLFVGIVGRELLDGGSVVIDDKDLLTAIAAQGLSQGDGFQMTRTATGTGVLAVQFNFLAFGGIHQFKNPQTVLCTGLGLSGVERSTQHLRVGRTDAG